MSLYNNISVQGISTPLEYADIEQNNVNLEYEHVFYLIETCIDDEMDQKVLKLASIGYSDDDISSALEIDKKEVRRRKKSIRSAGDELKQKLMESV